MALRVQISELETQSYNNPVKVEQEMYVYNPFQLKEFDKPRTRQCNLPPWDGDIIIGRRAFLGKYIAQFFYVP